MPKTCQIRWVMPIAEAKRAGLPTRATSPRDLPIAGTFTYTDHSRDAEATHEVRCKFDDGTTSEWIQCCEDHAAYSRGHLANWEERPLYSEREWQMDWEHMWRSIAESTILGAGHANMYGQFCVKPAQEVR